MTEVSRDGHGLFNSEIREGGRFRIENGVWKGVYGCLRKKNRFLWFVDIECPNTIVQATLDPSKHKMTPADI